MIDTGSFVDVLYLSVFQKLELAMSDLSAMTSSLLGFIGDPISPLGTVTHHITFREEPQSKMLLTKFIMVDLSYVRVTKREAKQEKEGVARRLSKGTCVGATTLASTGCSVSESSSASIPSYLTVTVHGNTMSKLIGCTRTLRTPYMRPQLPSPALRLRPSLLPKPPLPLVSRVERPSARQSSPTTDPLVASPSPGRHLVIDG
ncbi:hypothetical protein B296_00005531 [Ensete ventricosum]|uniref:Uncharacterized protein n=1 Tax=Ensete ventricosum TaxID=4639 RepID=A0A427APT1_ENSVE|nr:hypothetical protein B296_00005531 [Ensete ventricosum]